MRRLILALLLTFALAPAAQACPPSGASALQHAFREHHNRSGDGLPAHPVHRAILLLGGACCAAGAWRTARGTTVRVPRRRWAWVTA